MKDSEETHIRRKNYEDVLARRKTAETDR